MKIVLKPKRTFKNFSNAKLTQSKNLAKIVIEMKEKNILTHSITCIHQEQDNRNSPKFEEHS